MPVRVAPTAFRDKRTALLQSVKQAGLDERSSAWELIEPLDDRGIYAEFPGDEERRADHVAVGTPNYGEALHTLQAKGRRVLQGGVYNGVPFAYMPTDEDLGVITEIFDWPPGLVQEPDTVYP